MTNLKVALIDVKNAGANKSEFVGRLQVRFDVVKDAFLFVMPKSGNERAISGETKSIIERLRNTPRDTTVTAEEVEALYAHCKAFRSQNDTVAVYNAKQEEIAVRYDLRLNNLMHCTAIAKIAAFELGWGTQEAAVKEIENTLFTERWAASEEAEYEFHNS